jgi:hypothetical protein
MSFPKKLSDLCTPSRVYFLVSLIVLILSIAQNFGNTNKYCLGSFSCEVPSTMLVFGIKIVYIMFWAWILNLICKDGKKNIAWFLVLLPFLLYFVIIGAVMLNQKKRR